MNKELESSGVVDVCTRVVWWNKSYNVFRSFHVLLWHGSGFTKILVNISCFKKFTILLTKALGKLPCERMGDLNGRVRFEIGSSGQTVTPIWHGIAFRILSFKGQIKLEPRPVWSSNSKFLINIPDPISWELSPLWPIMSLVSFLFNPLPTMLTCIYNVPIILENIHTTPMEGSLVWNPHLTPLEIPVCFWRPLPTYFGSIAPWNCSFTFNPRRVNWGKKGGRPPKILSQSCQNNPVIKKYEFKNFEFKPSIRLS